MPKGVYDRSKATKRSAKNSNEDKAPARRGRPPKAEKMVAQVDDASCGEGCCEKSCGNIDRGLTSNMVLYACQQLSNMRSLFIGPEGNKEIVAKIDRIVGTHLSELIADPAARKEKETTAKATLDEGRALMEAYTKAKDPEPKAKCAPVPNVTAPAPVPMPAPVPFTSVPAPTPSSTNQ